MIDVRELASMPRWWRPLASLQDLRPPSQHVRLLQRYADLGGRLISGWQSGQVIGSIVSFRARADLAGPLKASTWSCIHVHPKARGRGVSVELREAAIADDRAQGFEAVLLHAFETAEIERWCAGLPGARPWRAASPCYILPVTGSRPPGT